MYLMFKKVKILMLHVGELMMKTFIVREEIDAGIIRFGQRHRIIKDFGEKKIYIMLLNVSHKKKQ